MQKLVATGALIFICFFPVSLFALEGYLGENPGLNFYSKIDDGTYSIQKKLVTRELTKSKTFDSFGSKCANAGLLKGIPTSEIVLEELKYGNYTGLSRYLKGKTITTDGLHSLATCLADKYARIQNEVQDEQEKRERIATTGLYLDGNKVNSDYDIISDIEKINSIIFSTDIKYSGTSNQSSRLLAALIAGKSIDPLIPSIMRGSSPSPVSATNPASGNPTSTSTPDNPSTTGSPSANSTLGSLIGDMCVASGSTQNPVDLESDAGFVAELEGVLMGQQASSPISGYSAYPADSAGLGSSTPSGTSSAGPRTSDSDFFHLPSCKPGEVFCIDVKMIPGGSLTLAGGKNKSIEGMLDKFTQHLYPISESSLAYQVMTNNAASLPQKDMKLVNSIGGLKVYLASGSPKTKRVKQEMTKSREEAELAAIMACGFGVAGNSSELRDMNTIGGAGFHKTSGTDTTNILTQSNPLGKQEVVALARQSGCYSAYLDEGRNTYYNSFSTDLSELQRYTADMLSEIRDMTHILAPMNNKPIK